MPRSRWGWIGSLLVAVLCWGLLLPTALAAPMAAESAEGLFELHCAGCHVNGGNIVRRGKTLKQRALQRNGVDSIAAITALITHGKGIMSAYGDRLSPEEIDLLAHYVWDQAQTDWQ